MILDETQYECERCMESPSHVRVEVKNNDVWTFHHLCDICLTELKPLNFTHMGRSLPYEITMIFPQEEE